MNDAEKQRREDTVTDKAFAVLLFAALMSGLTTPNFAVAQDLVIDLSGVWDFGGGAIVRLSQQGQSLDSTVLDYECTGGEYNYVLRGTLQGEKLTGTAQICTPAENKLVTDCGLNPIWETPFEATVSRYEILGDYQDEHWVYDVDDDGRLINCRLDYNFEKQFYANRLDCNVLKFEELAQDYPAYAHEIDLAKQFESGKKLVWTDNQKAPGGLKDQVEQFQRYLDEKGYDSTVNSAYRPLLYQAHFADMRKCALTLINALVERPGLESALQDSVDKLNAEIITNHGLAGEEHTVGAKTIRVPYVCWKEPLTNCPHVNQKAVDMTIKPRPGDPEILGAIADLDTLGYFEGFCRPYLKDDPPHWERLRADKCVPLGPGNGVIYLTGESPINIMLQDSLGRRIGFDPSTGTVVNEFLPKDSYYSGADTEPQIINLYRVDFDSFTVSGIGTGSGPYSISINVIGAEGVDGTIYDSKIMNGFASLGQPIEEVNYTFLRDYSQSPPFRAADVLGSIGLYDIFEIDFGGERFIVTVANIAPRQLIFSDTTRTITMDSHNEGNSLIVIPKKLLDGEFRVIIDGKQVGINVSQNQTHSTLQFDAPSDSIITIQGTTVIPEFSVPLLVVSLMMLTVIVLYAIRTGRNTFGLDGYKPR